MSVGRAVLARRARWLAEPRRAVLAAKSGGPRWCELAPIAIGMVALLLASALGACTLATSTGSPTERPRGSPTERLLRDGYAVLDGALTAEEVREVRKSCASLQARGAMRHLGQEGRDDSVCVLDPARLDHPSYGALSLAAA